MELEKVTGANPQEKLANFTAYSQTEELCRDELSKATLDVDSFKQKLQRCSLSTCHGMCCSDSVFTNQETADVIQRVVEEEAEFFKAVGLDLPAEIIVDDEMYDQLPNEGREWNGFYSIKKIGLKKKPFSTLVSDYPSHFKDTTCLFQVDDGRCGLQMLSVAKGLHPWYYKPFMCWLFPIWIAPGNNQLKILLPSRETEPWILPGYDGFYTKMHCGKSSDCGQPAYVILQEELELLGKIVDRNFIGEIQESI